MPDGGVFIDGEVIVVVWCGGDSDYLKYEDYSDDGAVWCLDQRSRSRQC